MANNVLNLNLSANSESENLTIEPPRTVLSLSDLSQTLKKQKQNVPTMTGDDAILTPLVSRLPNAEESRLMLIFQENESLIRKKASEDSDYAARIANQMEVLSKKSKNDLIEFILEEGDSIKIDFLKKTKPNLFSSPSAALQSFLNDATFGQLSRIRGLFEVLNDKNFETAVLEKSEELRLLQKAFPKSTIAGSVLSFLVPGSPVRALFNSAAKLVSKPVVQKTIASALSKLADPKTQNLFQKTTEMVAGGAAVSFVQGLLGENLEELNLNRAVSDALMSAPASIVAGVTAPILVEKGAALVEKISPKIKEAAKFSQKVLEKFSAETTGIPARAFKVAREKSKDLVRVVQTPPSQKGHELLEFLESRPDVPILRAAESALENLPPVNATEVLQKMFSFQRPNNPALDPAVERIWEWGARLAARLDPSRFKKLLDDPRPSVFRNILKNVPEEKLMISASKLNQWKREFQDAVKHWGTYLRNADSVELNFMDNMKEVAFVARQKLMKHADELAKTAQDPVIKNSATAFLKNMELVQDQVNNVVSLLDLFGKKLEVRLKNAETVFQNLFGKNKNIFLKRLEKLDAAYGTDFAQIARLYETAKQLGGPHGMAATPPILPTQTTGRSLLGTIVGGALGFNFGATGGGIGAATGAVLSSPRFHSIILGASNNVTGFIRQIFSDPEVLERLSKARAIRNLETKTFFSVPEYVNKIARTTFETFSKEGILTASSFLRLVADTPMFLTFVHSYDLLKNAIRSENKK